MEYKRVRKNKIDVLSGKWGRRVKVFYGSSQEEPSGMTGLRCTDRRRTVSSQVYGRKSPTEGICR